MEVVCIEEQAFYTLFDKVVDYVDQKYQKKQRQWIDSEEAMEFLNISSKTTLQRLRDEGKIRFSQPQPRIILYDSHSINEYLDKHARNTF